MFSFFFFEEKQEVMKAFSDEERRAVVERLLKGSCNGALNYHDLISVADHFSCSRWTIRRVRHRYNESLRMGDVSGAVGSKHRSRAGRKGYNKAALLTQIQQLPHKKQMKVRMIATSLKVSVSVVQHLLKANAILRHSNTIKSSLTIANKIERVRFAVEHVDPETYAFDLMHNTVHIDEKWLNEEIDRRIYYLLPGEEPPEHCQQSKRFIGKIMFLSAPDEILCIAIYCNI